VTGSIISSLNCQLVTTDCIPSSLLAAVRRARVSVSLLYAPYTRHDTFVLLFGSKSKISKFTHFEGKAGSDFVMTVFWQDVYEGVSRSFRTGRLERELQMVQLSRCNCIAILWVSLVSFAAITPCVASQRVFVVVYLVIDSFRKLLDIPSYMTTKMY